MRPGSHYCERPANRAEYTDSANRGAESSTGIEIGRSAAGPDGSGLDPTGRPI